MDRDCRIEIEIIEIDRERISPLPSHAHSSSLLSPPPSPPVTDLKMQISFAQSKTSFPNEVRWITERIRKLKQAEILDGV